MAPRVALPRGLPTWPRSLHTLPPLLLLAACGQPVDPAPVDDAPVERPPLPSVAAGGFTEVTAAAGVAARHRLPTDELTNIVDSLGGGPAFADLDGDGWLDLVVLGGAASPEPGADPRRHGGFHLYHNRGDGTFEDATAASGIPRDTTGVALAVADVEGDGDRDLFIADRGPNRLFLNRGDGTFEDGTRRAGLDDGRFGVGAVFFDYDRDGDLDLYVTNYLEFDERETAYYAPTGFPGPLAYAAQADILYRNEGGGRFVDVSEEAGIAQLLGRGMSLVAHDFDEDGHLDVFVANDATENFLLLGDGAGHFEESGLNAGVSLGDNGERTSAMAGDVGDVDGDGFLDLAVSDTAYGALYCRARPGRYRDRSVASGLAMLCGQFVSWGQHLIDFDDDGDLDLFIVNGGMHHLVGWQDLLLANDGQGRFSDASEDAGPYFAERAIGRGSCMGDYDNDGDLDVCVTELSGPARLLRNDRPADAAWVAFDLVGRDGRDPFGTRLEVHAGGRVQLAAQRCPTGYLGQSDPRPHFGLPPGTERVERLVVTWPDGQRQELTDLGVRVLHRIEQPVRGGQE